MLIGIVGKPNVGKSTFFKSMTLADVEIANYPFATINPNTGAGHIKIKDVAQDFGKPSNPREGFVLGEHRFVPVELLDVAGLVPGAYEGKGLGNKFLDALNQANALIHVIDISGSTNEKGEPVEPLSYNPAEDIKFLEFELDMWFKRYYWQCEPELPLIDIELFKEVAKKCKLTGKERVRFKKGVVV